MDGAHRVRCALALTRATPYRLITLVKASSLIRLLVFIAPLLLGLLHATGLIQLPLIERLDEVYYDWRLLKTMPNRLDERIVIVDVDEKSLATIGRFPWNRSVMAKLTRELIDRQQARVLAYDFVFPEPDTSSGYQVLKQITGPQGHLQDPRLENVVNQLVDALDYDTLFAESLSGRNTVLGYYFTNDRGGYQSGALPKATLNKAEISARFQNPKKKDTTLTQWNGFGANYEPLAHSAALQGHFTPFIDPEDGVVRRVPLIAEHQGAGYEALSLAAFRLLLGLPGVKVMTDEGAAWTNRQGYAYALRLMQDTSPRQLGDESLQLKSHIDIPIDAGAMALVPFRGLPGPQGNAFRYISASEVLQGALPPNSLRGKAVFVGATAPGLNDIRITPVSKAYPGVEIHANLLSGMLDNTIATRPTYEMGFELTSLMMLSLILILVLPKLSLLNGALVSLLLMLATGTFNWLAYTNALLVLPLSSLLALILSTYIAYLAYAYFIESKAKRQITQLFGTYVPPELVDEMARDPEQYSLAAQSKEMTVMFCDIRNFTRLSETMAPTQLSELVNQVFSAVTEVVQAHRGTLDKYLGDAVMAFWGAPVDAPNHAELAVSAALAIEPAIAALNERNRGSGLPEISLGVGVNTGTMFVGDMGSKVRRAYTVVGDAVNLASRLESLTRMYDVQVICGEQTRQLCPSIIWRELDKVRVKGKQQSVNLFEPMLPAQAQSEQGFTEQMRLMLHAYRQRDFAAAQERLKSFPQDKAIIRQLFAQRLEQFQRKPPPEAWDGSSQLEMK